MTHSTKPATVFLEAMTLDELTRLQIQITALCDAGILLAAKKLNPVFCLEPGWPMQITINAEMPDCERYDANLERDLQISAETLRACFQAISETEYPTEAEPAQTGTGPTTPVGESAGGGARDTAAPSGDDAEDLAEAAPIEVEAECAGTAPVPAKAPAGVQASHPGVLDPNHREGVMVFGPLSDDEKQTILDLHAKNTSRADIAAFLNRKVQTVALFLTHYEKNATAQAVAEAADDPTPTENLSAVVADPQPITEQPGGSSSPAEGDDLGRVAGRDSAAPAPGTSKTDMGKPISGTSLSYDLKKHLTDLPRKNGWTLKLDAELMRLVCTGAQFHHIELDLGVQKAKERFNLLTDSRSFERQKVAVALAAMVADKPASAAKA